MAQILPRDLPAAGSVNTSSAIIIDDGSGVKKATPAQLVSAGFPVASQAEAEAGIVSDKAMTPQRVSQAIDALGVSQAVLASTAGASQVGTSDGGTVQSKLDSAILVDEPFSSTFAVDDVPVGVASGLVYLEATRDNTVDLVRLITTHQSGSAAYSLHITDTAQSGTAGGGGAGVAMNGAGTADAIVANRYDGGQGNGLLAQRVGTGNGYGVLGSFSSLGTGAAIYAVKQNGSGGTGTGPALSVENLSDQGEAINSVTTSNNASAISNIFERRNVASGFINDVRVSVGGTRTAPFTGERIYLSPDTSWDGAFAAKGLEVVASANVTGSPEVLSINVANSAAGNTNAYGIFSLVGGANTSNYAGYFSASGASNNFGIYVAAGASYFDSTVNTAAHYQVGGVKVVGAQGAAVADATDAASVITQLNALLSRLRAHGLIAT